MLVLGMPHPAVTGESLKSAAFDQAPKFGTRSMPFRVSVSVFDKSKALTAGRAAMRFGVTVDMRSGSRQQEHGTIGGYVYLS